MKFVIMHETLDALSIFVYEIVTILVSCLQKKITDLRRERGLPNVIWVIRSIKGGANFANILLGINLHFLQKHSAH